MKIAFTGTSGSGKTTLVNYVKEKFNLTHLNGSSGELMGEHNRQYLKDRYGFEGGKGHAHVIQQSHLNPEFGLEHQICVLKERGLLILTNDAFVTDRSPLDNYVYFLLQTGLYQDEDTIRGFKESVIEAMSGLTHLIFIPRILPQVENNGSRIALVEYQTAVNAVFRAFYKEIVTEAHKLNSKLRVLTLEVMDLELRKARIYEFLTSEPSGLFN